MSPAVKFFYCPVSGIHSNAFAAVGDGLFMTMSYITYAEKLKDPRWQKMRLQVLEMNDWTCQYCGDKEKTLHAHHICYNNVTRNPWDVDIYALLCLCENCHKVEHLKNLTPLEKELISELQMMAQMKDGKDELLNLYMRTFNEIILKHKG